MKSCEEIKILISAYVDDEVTVEEKQAVEEHIKTCSECREEMNSFKDMNDVLNVVEAPQLSSVALLKFKDTLSTEINGDKYSGQVEPANFTLRFALSGVFILIFAISLFFYMENRTSRTEDPLEQYLQNPSDLTYAELMKDMGNVSVVQIFGELNFNLGEGWKKAHPYMPVKEGSELSTPQGSSAIISIQKTTEIKLQENTSIKVYDRVRGEDDMLKIVLEEGTIDASVRNFTGVLVVDTKFGDIKVHGTKFKVITNESAMAVEVTEGTVSFEGKGEPVFVQAPNRMIIRGSVFKVEPLDNLMVNKPSDINPIEELEKLTETKDAFQPILTFNKIPVYFPPVDASYEDILQIDLDHLGYRKLDLDEVKDMYGEFWDGLPFSGKNNNAAIFFKNNDGDLITVQMIQFKNSIARKEWWLNIQPSYEIYNESVYKNVDSGLWAFRSNNDINLYCYKGNWSLTVSINDKPENPQYKGEMIRDSILRQLSKNNKELSMERQ